MVAKFILKVGAVAFVAWGAWTWWHGRPVEPPPGVLAPDDPWQQTYADGSVDAGTLTHAGWKLTPRAAYAVKARVLSREPYAHDDLAGVSPLDFALGWGPMSDSATLADLRISQGARFYLVRWDDAPPASPQELMSHSANTHLIPANASIARRLDDVRQGEVVTLEGQLVDARRDDGWEIRSSLRRDDTGAGACEVLYVESVDVERAR